MANFTRNSTSPLPGIQMITKNLHVSLAPVSVLFAVLCIIGVIGNTFVLVVYKKYSIRQREETYFVPILALFDLFASISLGISSILKNSFFISYPSEALCKILNFMICTSSGASAGFIFVIAFQRYKKICKNKSLSIFQRRSAILGVIAVYFIINIPIFVFSGCRQVSIIDGMYIIRGRVCEIGTGQYPMIETGYLVFLLVWILMNLIATICFYVPIGCMMHKSFSKVSPNGLDRSPSNISSQIEGHHHLISSFHDQHCDGQHDGTIHQHGSGQERRTMPSVSKLKSKKSWASVKSIVLMSMGKSSRRLHAAKNFNWMVTSIIVTFVVSYFTTCMMLVLTGRWGDDVYKLSAEKLSVYRVLQNLTFLSFVFNPFIYMYFDIAFRLHLKATICHK